MKTALLAIGIIYIVIFTTFLIFAFISKYTGKDKLLKIIINSFNNHLKIWNCFGFFFWLGVIFICILLFH